MKKKLFLAIAIVAILTCLFAISISAAEPEVTVGETTYKFGTVTTVEGIAEPTKLDTTSRILVKDSDGTLITYPAYYFLPDSSEFNSSNAISSSGTLNAVKVTKADDTAYTALDIIMLEIPVGVTTLKSDALFSSADSMVYCSMPSITGWGNEAHFSGLDSLVVMDISRATETTYLPRGFVMNSPEFTTIIWPTTSKIKSIARGAFTNCDSLTSITLPEGLTQIGEDSHNNPGTFEGCDYLSEVKLPSTLTFIGKKDFLNCVALTSIEIPSGVSRICREAFQNCSSLTTITCKDVGANTAKNLYIGHDNFTGTMLTSVTFLQDTVTVDENAFKNLTSTQINIKALSGSIGKYAFYQCKGLIIGDFSGITSIGQYAFQNTNVSGNIDLSNCKSVSQQAFDGCTQIKTLKFGPSLTAIYAGAFQNCSAITFVHFDKNTVSLDLSKNSQFENCTALKAIAFPDCVKTLSDRILKNCDSLKAVYLPANLETLMTNGYSHGSFALSEQLYFVDNWFEVIDADGNFLGDSFTMPERKDVYFFPQSLTNLYDKGTGTGFHQNFAINPVLVFGTNVTKVNINDGLMCQCGKNEAKAVVFLGDMTDVKHSSQISDGYSRLINISYYFANANDKSVSDVNIIANNTTALPDSAKIYFCASKTSYKMIPKDATWGENLGEGHIHNPKADKTSEATCTLPAGAYTYCFCGVIMTSDIVEGSEPLGHSDIDAAIVYYYKNNNYFETSYKKFTCTREDCGEEIDEQNGIPALFIAKGMTVPDYGISALCHAIQINLDAVEEYNAFLGEGNEIKYGVLAGVAIDGNKPVGADGKSNCDAIVMGFESTKFSIIQLKLTGLEKANKQLYCGAYAVVDGTVSYLYEGVVSDEATPLTVNNGILDQTTPEATVEETKENA